MPLVYVHGIGNRRSRKFDNAGRLRDALFRRYLVSGEIHSPFWGNLGGTLRWNGASFPLVGTDQPLGGDGSALAAAVAAASPGDPSRLVVDTAHVSFTDAVDLIIASALREDLDLPVEDLAELGTRLVDFGIEVDVNGIPDKLAAATDDEEFLRLLREAVDERVPVLDGGGTDCAMGMLADAWTLVRRGLNRLKRAVVRAAAVPAVRAGRRFAVGGVPLLIGDVSAYLAGRGTPEQPGPIPARVLAAIDKAVVNAAGEPLMVVAHSMGGNIVYDLLTHFRPNLAVDSLVTVGSQVGLFEELKLFATSRADIPGPGVDRVPKPPGVQRWVNVVDDCDPLAFRAAPVFDGVEDYTYPSGALWAHTAYMAQPHFHRRLADRLGRAV
jgi:hypothetical protein